MFIARCILQPHWGRGGGQGVNDWQLKCRYHVQNVWSVLSQGAAVASHMLAVSCVLLQSPSGDPVTGHMAGKGSFSSRRNAL
jgi:hypothetical protein